jgi:hypothetical protein
MLTCTTLCYLPAYLLPPNLIACIEGHSQMACGVAHMYCADNAGMLDACKGLTGCSLVFSGDLNSQVVACYELAAVANPLPYLQVGLAYCE